MSITSIQVSLLLSRRELLPVEHCKELLGPSYATAGKIQTSWYGLEDLSSVDVLGTFLASSNVTELSL